MLKFLFKKRQKILEEDVKLIVPSTNELFDKFKDNIRKTSAVIYAQETDKQDGTNALQGLIKQFEAVALDALKTTLIETGFKKSKRKFL